MKRDDRGWLDWIFLDRSFAYSGPELRIGWVFVGVAFAVCLAIVVFWLAIAKPINEASCNEYAATAGGHVETADYRLWSDECYLTLDDGSTVTQSQHRTFQKKEVN